ncbi:hypothetical protein A3D03_00155 [Candidatus Gottesmanbacteria bacterium RIFCSPHIGHO2_02_FULL_40_13]|uniref:DUF5678 domain-containing protein n=1 Tax=Candidatus Gottesmanbacteria bacterium RIFCSPHIGHO2_02_FULL_40_13 TaxID=1798384 RepID=A0A1F6ACZ3_9BACT|nr:MAG: hypothetical protein A3D03_00155 [Candidatus Gottesmanbacteria bacterium RIFCSPHIGHO2_02_FULL_40_13]
MAAITNTSFDFTNKAKGIYYRLKNKLVKKYPADTYVCIEPETGDYFLGKSAIEVMQKSEKKYPSKHFFVAQLGRMSGLLK